MFSAGFKFIDIERLKCESFQDYLERCYFVINNMKNGKYNYGELVEKSLMFHSIKVIGCRYSPDTMNEIREMVKYAGVRLEK